MNNTASQPLLRIKSHQQQPLHNYIQAYHTYQLHCNRTANYLLYFIAGHMACSTLYLLFPSTIFTLNQLILTYVPYIPWFYLLYQYQSSYPQLDPHSLYHQPPKTLIMIHIDHKTYLLTLCLLLIILFPITHLFFTYLPLMLLVDAVFILLTCRSVLQTMLRQKQIRKRLEQMESSRLYVIEPFMIEDMKQPFEMEQMENMALVRNSSLNHLVPQFMHSFYKPKRQIRLQSQVQPFDQSQLYSH